MNSVALIKTEKTNGFNPQRMKPLVFVVPKAGIAKMLKNKCQFK
jgi:hypothetical protein